MSEGVPRRPSPAHHEGMIAAPPDSALLQSVRALLASSQCEGRPSDAARIAQAAAVAGGDPFANAAAMVTRVASGEPLGYVLGTELFMDIEILTAPGALAPRPETELLGEAALALLRETAGDAPRVIDMCCGSGNLACAIATHDTRVRVWASDLTAESVAVAQWNVTRTGNSGRVTVHRGDLFASLEPLGIAGTIDLVVCNPPYISQGRLAGERADLLVHEPREAFDGGPYGLTIHQRVVRDAMAFLRVGGALLCEIGVGQERQLRRLLDRTGAYDEYQMHTDRDGRIRVVTARFCGTHLDDAAATPESKTEPGSR